MNAVRSWLPRPKARFALLILASGCFIWGLFYLSTPEFPRDRLPNLGHDLFPPRPHRYPPQARPFVTPLTQSSAMWIDRAEQVKRAFLHAYHGYMKFASPHDELVPLTDAYVDNFNGWGVTLIDALDTMWLMDLRHEFQESINFVANMTLSSRESNFVPFFETVIRYLGGLLSAYALSKEPVLLARADDLGKALLPAFNTSSGMPMYAVDTVTGETKSGWTGMAILWSEALSCQVEYKYLAHLTGRSQYYQTVEKIMDIMRDADIEDGMFPTRWAVSNALPLNDQFSVGAFADSAHEYFLKQWLLSSQTETKAKDLYMRAVNGILNHLLYLTPNRKLLYVTDATDDRPSHAFEHLSCFLPGLLALGSATLPLSAEDRQLHLWAAEGIAYTCWTTYADHDTGLGPDEMTMDSWENDPHKGRWLPHVDEWRASGRPGGIPPGLAEVPTKGNGERDYFTRKDGYLLRPETVESFYYLWRITGNIKWRERGWAVFQAIEQHCKTSSGYASLNSVEHVPAPQKNEMPSFFMAETLKYLYLLFRDDDLVPLDRWVFNTEAHPLPKFEWSNWEKKMYGIPEAR